MRLKELGFYSGTPTGRVREGTQSAIKAYQRANGLSNDGVAGPQTWKKLTEDAIAEAATPVPTGTPAPTVAPTVFMSPVPSATPSPAN